MQNIQKTETEKNLKIAAELCEMLEKRGFAVRGDLAKGGYFFAVKGKK
jgi:hypothetical protein